MTATPAAGYVSGPAPIFIGVAAGIICWYAIRLKNKFGYDDALDVVGVHLVGGLVGSDRLRPEGQARDPRGE